jgi:hypothetical protein
MKLIFITLALAFCMSVQAQKEISASIFQSHVGLKSELSYSKPIKKQLFLSFGVQFLINQSIKDNGGFVFYKRFYARDFAAHWGASIGLERKIILPESKIEPFFFFKSQFTSSSTRSIADNNNYTFRMKRATSLENIIGLGFAAQLYKQFYLKGAAGLSTALVFAMPHRQNNGGYLGIEWAGYYSGGIAYRL